MATNSQKTVFTAAKLQKASRQGQARRDAKREERSAEFAKKRAERDAAKAARMEVQRQLLMQVTAEVLSTVQSVSFQEIALKKASGDDAWDSCPVRVFFFPTSKKTETTEGMEVELLVPQEETYVCLEGQDLSTEGVPVAMLLQGPYNKEKRRNEPWLLPGKKTVVDLLNDACSADGAPEGINGFSFALEYGRSRTYKNANGGSAKTLNLMCVWDRESYDKRLAYREKRRAESAAKRAAEEVTARKQITIDEYKAQQRREVDSEGFQAPKRRTRMRKT